MNMNMNIFLFYSPRVLIFILYYKRLIEKEFKLLTLQIGTRI